MNRRAFLLSTATAILAPLAAAVPAIAAAPRLGHIYNVRWISSEGLRRDYAWIGSADAFVCAKAAKQKMLAARVKPDAAGNYTMVIHQRLTMEDLR